MQIKAKGYKRPRGVTSIDKYTDEELEAARSLLTAEEAKVKEEMRVRGWSTGSVGWRAVLGRGGGGGGVVPTMQ